MTLKKWIALGGALSVLGFVGSVLSNMSLADESWFLQVAYRVSRGEVLYRDIFCGVTPLSVYLTALCIKVFGAEILVLKGINALLFATTLLLACSNLKPFSWNLLFSLCLLYPSGVVGAYGSVYNPLANLFFMGAFSCLFLTPGRLLMAAFCAALCFVSKQNIGLLALLAVVLHAKGKRGSVLAVFTCVSALILLPIVLSGGWDRFLDYAFLNKTTYLEKGISYFSYAHFFRFPTCLLFSLPLLVLGALTFLWWRDREPQTETLLIFCSASFLAMFPRADEVHLMIAIPMLLIGLIYAGRRLLPQFPWDQKLLALALGLFVLWTPLSEARGLIRGDRVMLTLNHFRGACVYLDLQKMIEARLTALQTLEKKPTFFLSPFAGFYYLALEIPNPTPFDFPFVTAFGKTGEEEVIGQLARGEIQSVVIDNELHSETHLQPTRLYNYVCKELPEPRLHQLK